MVNTMSGKLEYSLSNHLWKISQKDSNCGVPSTCSSLPTQCLGLLPALKTLLLCICTFVRVEKVRLLPEMRHFSDKVFEHWRSYGMAGGDLCPFSLYCDIGALPRPLLIPMQ